MTEKGMIFSAWSIPKLLNGTKTQTRRVMKNQPRDDVEFEVVKCPYAVGDRIWIREAWRVHALWDKDAPVDFSSCYRVACQFEYRATPEYQFHRGRWRSPIHLPQRFARHARFIITDIRAQRVQEISEEGAVAEGVEQEELVFDFEDYVNPPGSFGFVSGLHEFPKGMIYVNAEEAYQELWDTLHPKKHTWADNPWVWAYTLELVQ